MSAHSHLRYDDIDKKYINPLEPKPIDEGSRINGKDWKIKKDAFRVRTLGVKKLKSSNFKLREEEKLKDIQFKAKIKEMKQEKEDERKLRFAERKRRLEIKEEKERYARIAEKMHAKKVERLRKKEKRNKLLKER